MEVRKCLCSHKGMFGDLAGPGELPESESFKGPGGGGGGHREVLRYGCHETEPIFEQSEGAQRDPSEFEFSKGSGLGVQKWRTET